MTKLCTSCNKVLSVESFCKDNASTDGLCWRCKDCKKEYYKKNKEKAQLLNKQCYQKNRERILARQREYQQKNRNKVLIQKKKYNDKNKEKAAVYGREYRRKNVEKVAIRHTEYRQKNREKINYYIKNRLLTDISFRLAVRLRSRIGTALKKNTKTGSAIHDLGCSIPELKQYLEKQFLPGMTWKNWNHTGWHIDHIRPLASFDLQDRQQFLKACHYTNLQPLWARENIRKGAKLLGGNPPAIGN